MADYTFTVGKEAKFTADDKTLTTHIWLINGIPVSTAASFTYKFTETGTYIVRHEGSNVAGVTCTPVEKSTEIVEEIAKPISGIPIIVGIAAIGLAAYLLTRKKK